MSTRKPVTSEQELRYAGVELANRIVEAPLSATARARVLAEVLAFMQARLEQVVEEDPDAVPALDAEQDDDDDEDLSFLD